MARRTATITMPASAGRDAGKVFRITEMPAVKAEKWATRAFMALLKSGADIPEEAIKSGFAGIAALSLKFFAGVQFAEAEPLMDEMMKCITIIPDPRGNPTFERPDIETDLEEVTTILRLREEALSLHLGFSIADSRRKLVSAAMTAFTSLNTQTSPDPSESSSQAGLPH